jgi:hypothetical protein
MWDRFCKRLRKAPAGVWIAAPIILILNLWYDLRHVGGFVLDGVFLVFVLAELLRPDDEDYI